MIPGISQKLPRSSCFRLSGWGQPEASCLFADVETSEHELRRELKLATDEELELGLRSIAVPIRTRQNRIVAAINVRVHAARVSAAEMVHRFLPQLRESAQSLSQLLG
jgi:IclR family transcriptional regulator, pca regulon regulatory protein